MIFVPKLIWSIDPVCMWFGDCLSVCPFVTLVYYVETTELGPSATPRNVSGPSVYQFRHICASCRRAICEIRRSIPIFSILVTYTPLFKMPSLDLSYFMDPTQPNLRKIQKIRPNPTMDEPNPWPTLFRHHHVFEINCLLYSVSLILIILLLTLLISSMPVHLFHPTYHCQRSITPNLFSVHSTLKTQLCHKSFPP